MRERESTLTLWLLLSSCRNLQASGGEGQAVRLVCAPGDWASSGQAAGMHEGSAGSGACGVLVAPDTFTRHSLDVLLARAAELVGQAKESPGHSQQDEHGHDAEGEVEAA